MHTYEYVWIYKSTDVCMYVYGSINVCIYVCNKWIYDLLRFSKQQKSESLTIPQTTFMFIGVSPKAFVVIKSIHYFYCDSCECTLVKQNSV